MVLLAIYIVAASLFFPEGVQALNPVVCPEDTELDNARYALPGRPDNGKLEIVCTSDTYTETVGAQVLGVAAGVAALGLVCFYVSRQLLARYPSRAVAGTAPVR